jgi:hypothetical protein
MTGHGELIGEGAQLGVARHEEGEGVGCHGGCRGGARTMGSSARSAFCVLYVREGRKEEGERRRKRKERKRKEKKKKIWKFFQTSKFLGRKIKYNL